MIALLLLTGLGWLLSQSLAIGAFALRDIGRRPRAWWITFISLAILALPVAFRLLEPDAPFWLIAAVALVLPLPVVKLVDAHVGIDAWRAMTWRQWVLHVANIHGLCWRAMLAEPRRPRAQSLRWLLRGVVEVAAGVLLLTWAVQADLGRFGFWVEHFIKLTAGYLLAFDGLFALATGANRLAGVNVVDGTRHPILAATPADFWRRYNRDPGRFFLEDVYKPAGGRHHPVRGVLVVFAVNGLLHEYLAVIVTGRLTGYMLAFFALHAAAVAVSAPWKPRGARRFIGWACTFCLLVVSSPLFLAPIDLAIPLYDSWSPPAGWRIFPAAGG